MRILLARHGDTHLTSGKLHGDSNEPLSTSGRIEAYKLANSLKKYNPEMIHSSPIKRAVDTTRILSKELNIPFRIAKELEPLPIGDFENKPNRFAAQLKYYLEHPEEPIPGGKSVNEWAAKYLPYFEKYLKNPSKGTHIFMTHGKNILVSKGYMDSGQLAPHFDKRALTDNKETTAHGGFAIAEPPNYFHIATPEKVAAGRS